MSLSAEPSVCTDAASGTATVAEGEERGIGQRAAPGTCSRSVVAGDSVQSTIQVATRFDHESGSIGRGRCIDAEDNPKFSRSQDFAPGKTEDDASNRGRIALVGIRRATLVVDSELRMSLERAVARKQECCSPDATLSNIGGIATGSRVGN